MQPESNPVVRAFQISKSGRYSSFEEMLRVLNNEGYSTKCIEGRHLRKQLRDLIATAWMKSEQPR